MAKKTKKEKKEKKEKIKLVNRSVYFFSIEATSLDPMYNDNIKNNSIVVLMFYNNIHLH